jgi:enolase
MIDASAGDLWSEDRYRFSLTDNSEKTGDELCRYWLDLTADYPVRYLEDPFHERDYYNWKRLTGEQTRCWIIGDNFYSSDAGRIDSGAMSGYTHGAIIKPNQAGTVTDTIRAIESARMGNQIVIASHRSISTESTFLSIISCIFNIEYIKIGPLNTDYSSIIRLNEMMRMTGVL